MNSSIPPISRVVLAMGAASALLAATALAQEPPAAAPAPVTRDEKAIPLGEAFPDIAAARGHVFRARQLVLAPGARTELISHEGRPSITYVTKGVVHEHRTGAAAPLRHTVGAATMDRGAITHFWENPGPEEAVLLVVEVTPQP